jgi:hypothetical protein
MIFWNVNEMNYKADELYYLQFKVPEKCKQSGTDYFGGYLAKVDMDTEEKCVQHCQTVPDCVSITFVGPNPSHYSSSVEGCYMKKGDPTVRTEAKEANVVSIESVEMSCGKFQSSENSSTAVPPNS